MGATCPTVSSRGWSDSRPSLKSRPRPRVHHAAAPHSGVAGWLLAAVVDAIADDTWSRLKSCPDCQWIFYDRTRNRSKVWCDMLAGDAGGRSCGTIAKVNRYRQRHASE